MPKTESVIELKKFKSVARTCLNVTFLPKDAKPSYDVSEPVLYLTQNKQIKNDDFPTQTFMVPVFEISSWYKITTSTYQIDSHQTLMAEYVKHFKKLMDYEDKLFFSLLDILPKSVEFSSYQELKDLLLSMEFEIMQILMNKATKIQIENSVDKQTVNGLGTTGFLGHNIVVSDLLKDGEVYVLGDNIGVMPITSSMEYRQDFPTEIEFGVHEQLGMAILNQKHISKMTFEKKFNKFKFLAR